MKLTDLEPRFYSAHGRPGRIGLLFLCPCCRTIELPVPFANPLDGAEPEKNARQLWQRDGDTFETLTLTPSVDASKCGGPNETHWHGFLRKGEIVTC